MNNIQKPIYEDNSFTLFDTNQLQSWLLMDYNWQQTSQLYYLNGKMKFTQQKELTSYWFAIDPIQIRIGKEIYNIIGNTAFCVPLHNEVIMSGKAVLINTLGSPITSIAWPMLKRWLNKYISGDYETSLVQAQRKWMPSINSLYFCTNSIQQEHTHPSIRFGTIISWQWECITPQWSMLLKKGNIWLIKEWQKHKFNTWFREFEQYDSDSSAILAQLMKQTYQTYLTNYHNQQISTPSQLTWSMLKNQDTNTYRSLCNFIYKQYGISDFSWNESIKKTLPPELVVSAIHGTSDIWPSDEVSAMAVQTMINDQWAHDHSNRPYRTT